MRICFYAFGSTFPFLKKIEAEFASSTSNFEAFYLFPTSHWIRRNEVSLPSKNFLDLSAETKALLRSMAKSQSAMKVQEIGFGLTNVHHMIDAQKFGLQRAPGARKGEVSSALYQTTRTFLQKVQPDAIVFAHPAEGLTCLLVQAAASDLGIPVRIPVHLRNLDRSAFATDSFESIILSADPEPAHLNQAKRFVQDFRAGSINLRAWCPEANFHPNFFLRAKASIGAAIDESYLVDRHEIVRKLGRQSAPAFARVTEAMRRKRNLRKLRKVISPLPQRFIYFPLQYTPEATIHGPAPYFVDQLRVIDLLRYSLPSGYCLVVKEHPTAVGRRHWSFWRQLQSRSGVCIVDSGTNSLEVIKESALTVSVTGTACFEAFLLGKPSLTLAKTFFSDQIATSQLPINSHSQCNFPRLNLTKLLDREVGEAHIVESIARLIANSDLFVGNAPDLDNRVMNDENVRLFTRNLSKSLFAKSSEIH